ncbi:DUF4062 domain-containing protein [Brochothrix thermosphacta]|uniref:DUF4062 domain-containing protein n=1 Tax=Brochothrix thermosphacta TaxID=2756 RepID=UPI000EA0F7D6|nr:DUF4062 domain-containing protein [Brochothrix thermosphacta]
MIILLFRPRIFISSTFKENEETRKKLEEIFTDFGAEPLLYESVLTPSVLPLTYRQNILDSDFIILILKQDYGTKTNSGLSGTHEEYRIAKNNNVPMHVYILKNEEDIKEDENVLKFKKELGKDNISYYYFKDEEELVSRIQKTTFTIAKEIMLNDIQNVNLPDEDIARLVLEKDYSKAISIFKIIDKAMHLNHYSEIDFATTTLFVDMFEEIKLNYFFQEKVFIDSKLNENFHNFLHFGETICTEIVNNTEYSSFCMRYNLDHEEIKLFNTKVSGNVDGLGETIQEYFNKYGELKKIIQDHKLSYDINF